MKRLCRWYAGLSVLGGILALVIAMIAQGDVIDAVSFLFIESVILAVLYGWCVPWLKELYNSHQ